MKFLFLLHSSLFLGRRLHVLVLRHMFTANIMALILGLHAANHVPSFEAGRVIVKLVVPILFERQPQEISFVHYPASGTKNRAIIASGPHTAVFSCVRIRLTANG